MNKWYWDIDLVYANVDIENKTANSMTRAELIAIRNTHPKKWKYLVNMINQLDGGTE